MCDCGATDCPSCGPAQGYAVRRVWRGIEGYVYENPEDEDEDEAADGSDEAADGSDEAADGSDEAADGSDDEA